jgi:hypothetical protein
MNKRLIIIIVIMLFCGAGNLLGMRELEILTFSDEQKSWETYSRFFEYLPASLEELMVSKSVESEQKTE